MTPLRDRLAGLARAPWTLARNLYRVLYACAIQFDALIDWCVMGIKCRFPELALPSALPVLGRERGIRRGFSETVTSYARRLTLWLLSILIKGSPYALMDQLAGYLIGHEVTIRVVNNAGTWYTRAPDGTRSWLRVTPTNWDWDAEPANGRWSRYWVLIYLPATLWVAKGKMGSTGGKVGARRGMAVGLTCTTEQGQTLRAIVGEWNPPHARCEWICLQLDAAAWDPTELPGGAGMPDGTWANWGIGTDRLPARLATGRYAAGRIA